MARFLRPEAKSLKGLAIGAVLLAGALALAGCMGSGRTASRKVSRAPAAQAEPAYETDLPPSDVPQASGYAPAPGYAAAPGAPPAEGYAQAPAYAPATAYTPAPGYAPAPA